MTKMSFPDRRTLNVLLTALLFAVTVAIVYVARAVIVIFAFSILFAYLINPIVRFLQRHSLFFKNLRGPHVAEAYLALLILLGLIAYGVGPQFGLRVRRLIQESPAMMESVYSGDIALSVGHENRWDEAQSQRAKVFLQQRREAIHGVAESVRQFVSVVFGGLLLIPILATFFLSDGENLANGVIHALSTKETYGQARALAADLDSMLRHYIRAKVILVLLSLAFCSIAMLLLSYRHALALGLMAGVLEFIPVAGWMAALLGLWRVIMDYWIAPRIMGHELEIHPLLAIFAVMVGGAVGGIVGIYLSVPLVAALRVIFRRFAWPPMDTTLPDSFVRSPDPKGEKSAAAGGRLE
jgi:predicted PurR-regulated permease PerM